MILGDCRAELPKLPSASVDVVLTDPPYPEIDREYGRWTEAEWFELMRAVVPECMRLLKPKGSAVFILQPNSERVGRMRTWLWEFMAWVGREWGIVQDHWWWNISTPPTVHCQREYGLMRPSLKASVWVGPPDCYRNQDAVLLPIAESVESDRRINRLILDRHPGGQSMRKGRCLATCRERGGSTPYNVSVVSNGDSQNGAGAHGHGAGTPMDLCDWWVRYLCPAGGTVLDPFMGVGTVPIAAVNRGHAAIGIESHPPYFALASARVARAGAVVRSEEAFFQGGTAPSLFGE